MKLARKAGLINTKKITISYTGKMTQEDVVMADGKYRLLTLTSSGTLTLSAPTMIEACIVGSGANGTTSGGHGTTAGGGAGGHMKNVSFARSTGGKAVIAAGGGGSSSFIGESVDSVSGSSGGTGGGGNADYDKTNDAVTFTDPGTGDGESKYPFGDENYFSGKPHCAGGGGGGFETSSGVLISGSGGAGGTNGGSGGSGSASGSSGGTGGVYGGGTGGQAGWNGSDATFYGGGGGAGGTTYDRFGGNYSLDSNGSGYQGVVYVRILTGNLAPLT